MKKILMFLSLGLVLLCTSCEDVLETLTVREDISIPAMHFIIDRLQQKDAGPDTLMDETFLLPLDSVLSALDYASDDLMEYLDNMQVKNVFFQLVDTANIHTFDFIDSARLTFSTPSVPEVTVAHVVAHKNRGPQSVLDLSLDLTDVTRIIKSKDSIRARIYGHVNLDSLPASVENVEIIVGGMMGMELKPKL